MWISDRERDQLTRELDEKGAFGPIKDGLTHLTKETLSDEEDQQEEAAGPPTTEDLVVDTSEEERELPGTRRPKRGEGWWGRGRPMLTQRKGLSRAFVDGAGHASPGRWKACDRVLPDDDIATELRKAMAESLKAMAAKMTGGSLRKVLFQVMGGGLETSPFPQEEVENLRSKLRKILVAHGFNDGSKRQGDADQVTDVRLAQELLKAFKDPDHYFGEWWAKGVWLGSAERPLPRTPALYDRKTKWSIKGEGEVLHG